MRKEFTDYFENTTNETTEVLLGNLMTVVSQMMDFHEGHRILRESGCSAESIGKLLSPEILLCSLVETIPENIDISEGVKGFSEKGIRMHRRSQTTDKAYACNVPFKKKLAEYLNQILLPLQINIGTEFEKSSQYFSIVLKNSRAISPRLERSKIRNLAGYPDDEFEEFWRAICTEPDESNPLYEVDSGKNLQEIEGMNVRVLLGVLFDGEDKEMIEKSQHILFHTVGVFVYVDNKISLIPASEKYCNYFNTGSKRAPNKEKSVSVDNIARITHSISAALNLALEGDNIEPHKYESLAKQLTSDSGIKFSAFNIRSAKIFNDDKNASALSGYVSERRPLLGSFYNRIYIGSLSAQKRVEGDLVSSVFRAQRRLSKFLNPVHMERRFYGDKDYRYPITAEDILMLAEHGEKYRPFLDKFVLADIFALIMRNHKDIYEEFRNMIGDKQIGTEIQSLKKRGFNKPKTAEVTALLQYFMHFGSMFLEETTYGVPNPKLPNGMRIFFKKYFATCDNALPEHAAVSWDPDEELVPELPENAGPELKEE